MSDATNMLLEVPAELNAALETVRENRLRLEKLMSVKIEFQQKHATAANGLANAVKVLSTETRLWAEQLGNMASKATAEQRTTAAVKHLLGLPPGPRAQAYKQLVQSEAARPQPIKLRVLDE